MQSKLKPKKVWLMLPLWLPLALLLTTGWAIYAALRASSAIVERVVMDPLLLAISTIIQFARK